MPGASELTLVRLLPRSAPGGLFNGRSSAMWGIWQLPGLVLNQRRGSGWCFSIYPGPTRGPRNLLSELALQLEGQALPTRREALQVLECMLELHDPRPATRVPLNS